MMSDRAKIGRTVQFLLNNVKCEKYASWRCLAKLAAAAAVAGVTIWGTTAEAGPFVQAGAYYHDGEFDELKISGNGDFPIILELSVGYNWEPGWYVKATHYSNPEAADTGLNYIGGGFRYEW